MESISYFLFSQSIHSFYMYSRAIVQRSFFFKKNWASNDFEALLFHSILQILDGRCCQHLGCIKHGTFINVEFCMMMRERSELFMVSGSG